MNHKFTGCLVAAVIWFGTAAVEAFSLECSGTTSPYASAVVAGTFAPGFDVFRYNYTFGIDDDGNMDSVRYGEAVDQGVFRPFGNAGHIGPDGAFHFSTQSDQTGPAPIWLFVLAGDNDFAICSSTSPNWQVPADGLGSLSINTSEADIFAVGRKMGSGIALNGGLPMPEPSPLALSAFAGLAWGVYAFCRRQR